MKQVILTIGILIYFITPSLSCTTFVLKSDKDLVFGRNLDWVSDNGLLVVNRRNQKKKSLVFPPDKSIEWTSKYGSVTFNQFGKEFPFGGINEKGLVIEIMRAKAEYPSKDGRKALNELQWIQYHLDNSSNINDIIEADKLIRISKVSQDLHFLISDKNGDVAVIEFINGSMQVYKNKTLPFPVLENSTYRTSLTHYKKSKSCRFVTTTNMVNNYSSTDNAVDYSFKILDKVALAGSWSIVYDIKNMSIYFKTASQKNIKSLDIQDLNFNCSAKDLMYDLKSNHQGKINSALTNFDSEINKAKMKDAMTRTQIKLPLEIKKLFYDFHKSVFCKED